MKTWLRSVLVLVAGLGWLPLRAATLEAESGVFTVDYTPPSKPVVVSPADGAQVTAVPVRLEVTATDALSGVADYRFEYGTDTSAWVPQPFLLVSSLTAGTWSWRCQARDRAGNESAWSDWSTFVLAATGGAVDADGDELPDAWEQLWFGRLDYSNGFQDSDGDGLLDAEEYAAGTDPLEFAVALTPGWNLLALPVNMSALSAAALRAVGAGPFWVWNGTEYETPVAPEAYQAFWTYVSRRTGTVVSVTGTVPPSGVVTLHVGWTLAGAGFAAHVPPVESNPILAFWRWADDRYVAGKTGFVPLAGYWIFSLGGTLDFESLRDP